MLLVTIITASLIGFCVLGYYVNHYRNKMIDCKLKYNATKSFAQSSAKRILELEALKSELSLKIALQENEISNKKDQDAGFKADSRKQDTPSRTRRRKQ